MPPLSSLILQPRDLQVFRGLLECRAMTLRHISAIYFHCHWASAKKRVGRLNRAGLLLARSYGIGYTVTYHLTAKSFQVLKAEGLHELFEDLSWMTLRKRTYVSEMTLQHELSVMDCKVAIITAIRRCPQFSIAQFSICSSFYQFYAPDAQRGRVLVKPDGFIQIMQKDGASTLRFFLEVDRSTETIESLARRIAYYRHHYKLGGLATTLGHNATDYRAFPYRVLLICKSFERLKMFANRLRQFQPPVKTFVILTTHELIAKDALAALGLVAHEPTKRGDSKLS